jgi:hypothetical protein
VVAVIALLLAYAMFTRTGGDKTAAPATGSSNSGLKIPEWVPIYPGTTPNAITSKSTRAEYFIGFQLRPNGGNCHQFLEYYDRKLNESGFRTTVLWDDDREGLCSSAMSAENSAHTRSIHMGSDRRADGYYIGIEVIQRDLGHAGAATGGAPSGPAPKLPDWTPIYPGTTPQWVSRTGVPAERKFSYSFSTADDQAKVFAWFEQKLKAMHFQTSLAVEPTLGGYLRSNTSDGRIFNIGNTRPGVAPVFHVDLSDP